MNDLAARVRTLQQQGSLALPLPGEGNTSERHLALMNFGRTDLSLGRLVEAHTDATAILAQDRRHPQHNAWYGVWASDGPRSRVTATVLPEGSWRLHGIKQYCSGASVVDAALVTAHGENDSILLFEVPMHILGIAVIPTTWASPAFADTATGPVSFDGVELPPSALVGTPNWYLNRPGFWQGAVGPAACWAGGALSLIDAAVTLNRKDPHSRAQLGALEALAWGLPALLTHSGREIDADPVDERHTARPSALKVRHLIERWCTEVMDRFGRATGPQLLAFDETVVRQFAALALYIRQCHGERDLEAICSER